MDSLHDYNLASPDRYRLLKEFAKENKKFPTEAETILWSQIKGKQLDVKFNRQHVIGDYIVDFVAIKQRLIIEVDGGYHSELSQFEKDEFRTEKLSNMGFEVIRFSNEEIICNIDSVLNKLQTIISNKK